MATATERKRSGLLNKEQVKEALPDWGMAVLGALGGGIMGAATPVLSFALGLGTTFMGAYQKNSFLMAIGAGMIASPGGKVYDTLYGARYRASGENGKMTLADQKDNALLRVKGYGMGLLDKFPFNLVAGKKAEAPTDEGEIIEGGEISGLGNPPDDSRAWEALDRIERELAASAGLPAGHPLSMLPEGSPLSMLPEGLQGVEVEEDFERM